MNNERLCDHTLFMRSILVVKLVQTEIVPCPETAGVCVCVCVSMSVCVVLCVRAHELCVYEDLSFISETGHDWNPLRLLRNVTQFVPMQTVKVETMSESFNMCKCFDHDQSQN